jgi:hypothetical protein
MANEKQQEEVVEQVADEKVEAKVIEEPQKDTGFQEDGSYKVDLSKPPVEKETTKEKVEKPVKEEKVEEKVEETEVPTLQEVTEEEQTEESVEEAEETVEEEIEDKAPEVELPENIEKLVEFMNETGGTIEDYARLNADYSNVDDEALLREYYKSTKPHLSSDEVNFMIEDNFAFDEESDEPRDVKRKKLAYKEAVVQAKNHLETLKSKYYQELKLGSKLSKDQQKAIEFFNRYNDEQGQASDLNAKQQKHFNKETDKVFNEKFKGFDFQVGDKKYRYNVKDVQETKKSQSDVMNVFSQYVSKDNLLQDAKGYHKSLFAARNADALANHFYEQGKADAITQMTSEAKNINLDGRKSADGQVTAGGQKVRVISGDTSSSSKFRLKNY